MLSLDKNGTPFAKIVGGKYNNTVISMGSDKGFKQLKIANDAKLQLVPDPKIERQILYITGPSGSGKSTFTRKYIEQYKKTFKENPVYLFSSLADDESLDEVEPKRVRLDASIYEDPILIQDFSNSIVIFDDVDVISDKRIREGVYNVMNRILEIGRHFRISCIVTNHLPSNRTETRRILNETHFFVYFPRSSSSKIKYVLTEYLGLDKYQISKFKKLNSRWICIVRAYPSAYLSEHQIGLLHTEDNEGDIDKKA